MEITKKAWKATTIAPLVTGFPVNDSFQANNVAFKKLNSINNTFLSIIYKPIKADTCIAHI